MHVNLKINPVVYELCIVPIYTLENTLGEEILREENLVETKFGGIGGNLIWRMQRNVNFGGNLIWRMAENIYFGGN